MRFTRHTLTCGIVLLLMGTVTNCAWPPSTGQILYQQGRTVVRLEPDDQAGGRSGQGLNTHPVVLDPTQLATILRGITVRSDAGFMATVFRLTVPAELIFQEEDLALLAPIVAQGLSQATPSERVGFTLWSTELVRRDAPLSGYVSVRDPYLVFGLTEHPTIGWQDPEDPSAPKLYELQFLREDVLRPGSEQARKATYKRRPVIQIEYQLYLRSLDEQQKPAVTATERPARDAAPSESERLNDLQQQVKELTESNQELRAKLKAIEARESTATIEELTRLRQELTEAKHLLADTVLELNRLKSKSGR